MCGLNQPIPYGLKHDFKMFKPQLMYFLVMLLPSFFVSLFCIHVEACACEVHLGLQQLFTVYNSFLYCLFPGEPPLKVPLVAQNSGGQPPSQYSCSIICHSLILGVKPGDQYSTAASLLYPGSFPLTAARETVWVRGYTAVFQFGLANSYIHACL